MNFEYHTGKDIVPDTCVLKISPSSLNKWFECSSAWYMNHVEHEGAFGGNTATVTGDVVHASAEAYANDKDITHIEIDNYISAREDTSDDIDGFTIRKNYPDMITKVCEYIDDYGKPDRTEEYIKYDLGDDIFIAGSADAVQGTTLVDYKTASAIRSSKDFENPDNKEDNIISHRAQLLAYAFMYNKMGIKIDTLRIVYITVPKLNRISPKTGKPMKDYPSEYKVVEEKISTRQMNWIEEQINIMNLFLERSRKFKSFLTINSDRQLSQLFSSI